jgi:transglutaminase-like putative cysteine protease
MIKKFEVFLFTLILLTFFLSCKSEVPVITSIDPAIGRMGEIITLTGSNFGDSREDTSYVTIAGISPTSSSYHLWQDDLIIVRVPELGDSGLVYVHARGRRSNGVLFSNIASIPRPVDGEDFGLEPRITSINPQAGAPGSLITITGNNFGVSRENSLQERYGVFFSWDFVPSSFNPFVVREPEFIEVSEIELGYESWSTREIRVRLPDGAISGNIEIRTPHGRSKPFYFDVTGKPGTKIFKDKRLYTITYSVDIRVLEASRPNTLYLWIPRPIMSPSQRNVQLVSRNAEPFLENHRGVSLFKLDNLVSGTNQSITLSFRLETYTVESTIRPQAIRQVTSPLSAMYTQNTALIPSNNQQIRSTVGTIIGREQNPYLKARALYNWIITNIKIETLPLLISPITALEQRRADPYSAALLFTAMSRAAGVPCIPIAGVLVDRNGNTVRHYWAEFWIDGFGWVPVDPVMGSGALSDFIHSANFTPHDWSDNNENPEINLANFYFGNMDNQRIAFSRGDLLLSQIESRGRVVSHSQGYSLQNIWEESVGALESYSSLWGDIIITGVYSQ